LEHCRIYYFHNGGDEEYFIGSADLMQRNLEHRVELLVPVEPPALRADLRAFLDAQLGELQRLWIMQTGGNYRRNQPAISRLKCSAPVPSLQAARLQPPAGVADGATNETILVIEGNEDLRVTIAELLDAMGYQTLRANTAEEAMSQYVHSSTQIDFFLAATLLPDMSGMQFLTAARRLRRESRALLFSAWVIEEGFQQKLRGLGVGFLSLPFTRHTLKNALAYPRGREVAPEQYHS
jgi:CheY-like chemotaxis protein